MMDFRAVARSLRKILQENPPATILPTGEVKIHESSAIARRSLVEAETEMAAQSVVYLFDHLVYHEQFREAATLLAFALPHAVRSDQRVRAAIEKASKLANRIDEPELELSHYLDNPPHVMPDWMGDPSRITKRGMYWLSVVKLTRCALAAEWGTGCGLNVIHAAVLAPETRFVGIDSNDAQITSNRKQWEPCRAEWLVDGLSRQWCDAFDCVAVLDTLEHTVHPGSVLDKAEAYLRPRGLMVVSVPNGPWSLHTPNDELMDAEPGNHVAVGSPDMMIRFLQTRGTVLDCRVLAGDFAVEGNNSLCITYEPRARAVPRSN